MLPLLLYAIQACTWSIEPFPYMQRRHAHAECTILILEMCNDYVLCAWSDRYFQIHRGPSPTDYLRQNFQHGKRIIPVPATDNCGSTRHVDSSCAFTAP
jgi:hypothetical protein